MLPRGERPIALSGLDGLDMSVAVAASLKTRSKIELPEGELGSDEELVKPVWLDCIDHRAFCLGIETDVGDRIAAVEVGLDGLSIDMEDLGVGKADTGVNWPDETRTRDFLGRLWIWVFGVFEDSVVGEGA